MAKQYLEPRVTPAPQTSDGGSIAAWGLRDGAAVNADWLDALAQAGQVFVANMGSVTTPLTFLVTVAMVMIGVSLVSLFFN